MALKRSFRFVDDDLNRRLIVLLKKRKVGHSVDRNGVIHYSPDDAAFVGNDLIGSIRGDVFSAWQVLTCPEDWIRRYRDYMTQHEIPFTEEISNGQLWFLLPRKHRPHAWKLEEQPVSSAEGFLAKPAG